MTDKPAKILIAVDGGGTGCRAAVGTVARGILASAEGGPANVSTDFTAAIANIRAAIDAAARQGGISADDLRAAQTHLSLAGVVDGATAQRVAEALPFANAEVSEDIKGAIAGALGMADGYVVALGTGTIIARQKARAYTRVGGWGFDVSDQASGAWLGHQLLRHVVLCADGISAHSDLTRTVLAQFGTQAGVMHFASDATPGGFGAFARQIVPAAEAGDAQARALMQEGADYVAKGLAALGFQRGDALCLSGGVGPHYAPYLPKDVTENLVEAFGSNLEGAFALARDAAVGG